LKPPTSFLWALRIQFYKILDPKLAPHSPRSTRQYRQIMPHHSSSLNINRFLRWLFLLIKSHQQKCYDSLEGTFTLQTIVVYFLASGVIKCG
jgi:hypothetical protein